MEKGKLCASTPGIDKFTKTCTKSFLLPIGMVRSKFFTIMCTTTTNGLFYIGFFSLSSSSSSSSSSDSSLFSPPTTILREQNDKLSLWFFIQIEEKKNRPKNQKE